MSLGNSAGFRFFFFSSIVLLSSCDTPREGAPAIGEAYAGPANLTLRKDIDLKSPAATVVHHGEKLDVVAQRRRLYRVRTKSGIEGWTDDRQLLDPGQMRRLRQLAAETAGMPSQGTATSFDRLNIHTEPNRYSPSFLQVKEGEKFDIVAHRVMVRAPLPKRQLVVPRPKLRKTREKKKSKYPEPDPPAAPKLPNNWIALSKERGIPVEDIADEQAPQDDWMLVRLHSGQSGWVLTGRLFLAIPDEVAQYAEGHRIMSYFSLGKIQDGDLQKDIWLWTTADHLGEDHDFDGYRVFFWNVHRHRYETAYIQRRIRGFFPVLARKGEFSVCLENDAGQRTRKLYTLVGNLVRSAGERPCDQGGPDLSAETSQQIVTGTVPSAAAENASWFSRIKNKLFGGSAKSGSAH